MGWTAPRTWYANETITSGIMNQHVRDELNVLKTSFHDLGYIRTKLFGVGYGSGQGCSAASVDTEMTNYSVTIPAGYLGQPGDTICVDAIFRSNVAGVKTIKYSIGAGALTTVFTYNVPISVYLPTRYLFVKRTSTILALRTMQPYGANVANLTGYGLWVGITAGASMDTTAQALRLWTAAPALNEIVVEDYTVYGLRSTVGALV